MNEVAQAEHERLSHAASAGVVVKSILELAALTQSGPKIDTELAIKVGVSRLDRAQALFIKG